MWDRAKLISSDFNVGTDVSTLTAKTKLKRSSTRTDNLLAKDFLSKKAPLRLCNCRLRSTKFRTEIFFSSALTVDFLRSKARGNCQWWEYLRVFHAFPARFTENEPTTFESSHSWKSSAPLLAKAFALFATGKFLSIAGKCCVCFSRSNLISIINISAQCSKVSDTTMGKCVKTHRRRLELDETSQNWPSIR